MSSSLQSQTLDKKHLSIGGQVTNGNISRVDSEISNVLTDGSSRFYDFTLNYNTHPSDSSAFYSDYNYPTFGVGFTIADFSRTKLTNHSHLGNIYTTYGFIDRPLLRSNRFKLGYRISAGLAYATNPYNPQTNPSNIFVSSPLMVFIGLGANLKYKVTDRIELGVDLGAKHYSNGRLGMPNKGINIFAMGVSASYYLEDQPTKFPKLKTEPFNQHFYYHVSLGGGMQTSFEEWQIYNINVTDSSTMKKKFKKYPKLSLSTDAMYRFSRKYGIGIGVDLFYTSHTDKIKEWDTILNGKETGEIYSPLSVGVSINQEVYFRNLALFGAFGYYAYRKLGTQNNESSFYQRAGFRYYVPSANNIFIGGAIKAHNFRMAEFLEIPIGYKFK